jgi:hypothetical protein
MIVIFTCFFYVENDDECVTAAETYSCGREKEPGIVDAIFNTEKGNATMVQNPLDYCSGIKSFILVQSTNSVHADTSGSMPLYKKCAALCAECNLIFQFYYFFF